MRIHVLVWLALPGALAAQDGLSLQDAVRTALEKHPSVDAGLARIRAAEARIEQARAGYKPQLNYTESVARSNNPVFVFSSLLTQRRFTEQNFQVGPLNRPEFLNNFQSLVTVDQLVFDKGGIKAQRAAAELGRDVAAEDDRGTRMQLIAGVAKTYHAAVLAEENFKVAQEAVRSAEADVQRAEAIRAAGMSTDADVLSIRVHLSSMREQEIRRKYEMEVARAALNEAVGLPLDTPYNPTTPLAPPPDPEEPERYEEAALRERPEARQTRLAGGIAERRIEAARADWWPKVGVRAAFEADRQTFVTRGGTNWLFAGTLRWNLFDGFATKARVSEAEAALLEARARERQMDSALRLEVRKARADRQSARERLSVASAAVEMAEESLRITKNRFEAGLATVTDLLRNELALHEARTRRLAAIYELRMAATGLELAAGLLNPNSEVLQ
ncbi:MAG: TolC family protein [Bryobacterales bacterium]|nr:TolC family protein [Bryobacterales bacterium]